jgi:hypothetical protein
MVSDDQSAGDDRWAVTAEGGALTKTKKNHATEVSQSQIPARNKIAQAQQRQQHQQTATTGNNRRPQVQLQCRAQNEGGCEKKKVG